jgi:Cof subfamily protein (haloacid dehalogenase superfamily)
VTAKYNREAGEATMSNQPGAQRHPVRLVIADVDGTLVTQDKVLTPRAIEAVKRLHDAGILFGVTSGRPPKGMKMLIEPLQLEEPLAGFNGGVVVKPDLTPIFKELLAPDVAAQALQLVLKHQLDVFLYSDLDWFVRDKNAPHVAREAWTVQFSPTVVKSFDSLLDRVVKIVGVGDDFDAVARCEKDMQEWSAGRVSAARSQPYYLDITHPKANKGEVVELFSKYCNVPPSEIGTIGDMPNDVLMFKKSGISIAMGNASPEVQKQATFVTASNQEEGFAKAMERLLESTAAS